MGVLNMIENNLQATAGEVLMLTSGEFDSHGVEAVVLVRKDINLRLLADAWLECERFGLRSQGPVFDCQGFIKYLVSEGAVERIQVRSIQLADDQDCIIASQRKDWDPVLEPEPLPYEWAESVYDRR